VGDGRPLIIVVGLALIASGLFAIFLALRREFLPHDIAFLGMTDRQLCSLLDCRVVRFMVHDRTAFGGTLVAIGTLYTWLAAVPLARREAWAWWAVLLSGAVGFASFGSYIGTGYLDTWHGIASLVLLPLLVAGLILTWRHLERPRGVAAIRRPALKPTQWRSRAGAGRALVMLTAFGMVVAGLTIASIGALVVFVPQDLAFIGIDRAGLEVINQRLVPLIAHDRAGFGGGVASTGVAAFVIAWAAPASRSFWDALLIAGGVGFGCAVGTHFAVGYMDLTHLGPAVLGAGVFAAGLLLLPRSAAQPPVSRWRLASDSASEGA
jgi:hypothetical protein